MPTQLHPLAADYLRRLDAAADGLPADRRSELVDGIREHLDAALAQVDSGDDAAVRAAIDRLGTPADIVAEAADNRPPGAPDRNEIGGHEVAAIVFLLVGWIVIPIVGWFVGVVLVWTSSRWSIRDKVLGTLAAPIGYGIALLVGLALAVPLPQVSGIMLAGVLWIVVQVLAARYLLTRARR